MSAEGWINFDDYEEERERDEEDVVRDHQKRSQKKMSSIQPGKYRARAQADSVQFGESKNGTEQIAITFDLLDESDAPSGQTITWIGFFSEKTEARTVESVGHCGWDMATGPTNAPHVADNVVELVLEDEPYEGKSYLRVKWINRIGAKFAFEKPMDQGRTGALFARIKSRAQSKPGAVPAAQPRRLAPQRPLVDGEGTGVDDIPF